MQLFIHFKMSQRKSEFAPLYTCGGVCIIIAANQQSCLLWEVDCIWTWLPIDGGPFAVVLIGF